jgi:hypothetical protein
MGMTVRQHKTRHFILCSKANLRVVDAQHPEEVIEIRLAGQAPFFSASRHFTIKSYGVIELVLRLPVT